MTQTETKHDAPVGLCWECGYALRGLESPRCPECGRAFDPADPATMNMGEHVGGLAGRMLRPPGWPLYVMTAVAVLLSLWAAAAPMPPGQIAPMLIRVWENGSRGGWWQVLRNYEWIEVRYAIAVVAWLVVATAWTARRIARGVTVRRIAPGQRAAPLAYWRRWLIPHVVLAATILVCRTQAPVFIGFWVSWPALDSARGQGSSPRGWTSPRGAWQWIGIYPVESLYSLRGLQTSPIPLMVNVSELGGFLYAPAGPPPRMTEYELRYLGDGWYSYYKADVYR